MKTLALETKSDLEGRGGGNRPLPSPQSIHVPAMTTSQSIHVPTMITSRHTPSVTTEHPCANHDNVLTNNTMLIWLLIFDSLSSSCSSLLVSLLFCCCCLFLPASVVFALNRTDPAFSQFCASCFSAPPKEKLDPSMSTNPHDNAFSH